MNVLILLILKYVSAEIYFMEKPKNKTAKLHEDVTLKCSTYRPISVVTKTNWFHNGSAVASHGAQGNVNYKLTSDGALHISNVGWLNNGKYSCDVAVYFNGMATDEKVTSEDVYLNVAYMTSAFAHVTPSKSALHGDNVIIQCISPPGHPPPDVTWLFDGRPITGYANQTTAVGASTKSELMLTKFSLRDTGSYTCLSANELLQKNVRSADIQLSIRAKQQAPYFVLKPSSVTSAQFTRAQIDCVLFGDPTPTLSWLKGNKTVVKDSRRDILKNGTLVFHRLVIDDVGNYTCVGKNFHGSIRSYPPAMLNVAFIGFDFEENPSSGHVLEKGTLALHCGPPPSYPKQLLVDWFKDFVKLSLDNPITVLANNTLLIENVRASDEGVYFCRVQNSASRLITRTSTKANIIVYDAPSITTTLTQIFVMVGRELRLSFVVAGRPTPNVSISQQFVNGSVRTVSTTSSYFLTDFQNHDQGVYTCRAENEFGKTSFSVDVNLFAPPAVLKQPVNITAVENSSATLFCSISGSPPLQKHWTHTQPDGTIKVLTTNSSLMTIHNDRLVFSRVTKTLTEGQYVCVGRNRAGEAVSHSAYLHILVPPKVTTRNSSAVVNESERLTLACVATGDPIVDITWDHDVTSSVKVLTSTKVEQNGGLFTTRSNLTLFKVSGKNSGVYTCNVFNNRFPEILKSYWNVTVQVAPTVKAFYTSGSLALNSTAVLSCSVSGTPAPRVYFTHNRSAMAEVDRNVVHSVVLKNLASINSGKYTCHAVNVLGQASQSIHFAVKVPPGPPTAALVDRSCCDVTLRWLPGFSGHALLTKAHVEYSRENSTKWYRLVASARSNSLRVFGLDAIMVYRFRVRLLNAVGPGEYSHTIKVTTLPQAPSIPVNLNYTNITSYSILIEWQTPVRGVVKSYEITLNSETQNSTYVHTPIDLSENHHWFWMEYLIPYTLYIISIRASTENENKLYWGRAKSIVFRTDEAIPDAGNFTFKTIFVKSNKFAISFHPVDTRPANGRIIGYMVQCTSLRNHSSLVIRPINNTQEVTIEGVFAYTLYNVSVAFVNSKGVGVYSQEYVVGTRMAAPGVIRSPVVKQIGNSSIKLSWLPPLETNGIINEYEVFVYNDTIRSLVTSLITVNQSVVLKNLVYNNTYCAVVVASTKGGRGNRSRDILFVTTDLSPTETTTPKHPMEWLQREFLSVVIGACALCLLLTISFIVVCIVKRRVQKTNESVEGSSWKANPFYGKGNTSFENEPINSLSLPRDLVWDDEAHAKTTSGKQLNNYSSVEPYQGYGVDGGPLVKLKGGESLMLPDMSFGSLIPLDEKESTFDISMNSLLDPPSLNNLDPIAEPTFLDTSVIANGRIFDPRNNILI